jgi:hypothetical protein
VTSRTPRFTRFRQDIADAFRRLFAPEPQRCPRPHHHPPTIIVAHSFPQAREYARSKGLGGDWVYPTQAEQLYGYRQVKLVLLDGWQRTRDSAFIRAVEQLQRFNEAGRRA